MNPNAIIAVIGTIRERAYRFLRTELESHGMQGLAPSHGAILSELFSGDELTMSELAARIDRDRSTVTTLIGKLEESGYVERRKSDQDGRVQSVRLTDQGRRLEHAFHQISRSLVARTYEGFSADEKRQLAVLLERVAANWDQ